MKTDRSTPKFFVQYVQYDRRWKTGSVDEIKDTEQDAIALAQKYYAIETIDAVRVMRAIDPERENDSDRIVYEKVKP